MSSPNYRTGFYACQSVCLSYVCRSVLSFPYDNLSKWVNANGFSPNSVCALTLWRSGLGLLMGKFHQFLTVICSWHPYFHFPMITLANINGFSPNLVCALILWKSALGLLIGKFRQFWQSHLPMTRPYFHFWTMTLVNINGFSPNFVCALILWISAMGLLMVEFCQFLTDLSARNTSVFLLWGQ